MSRSDRNHENVSAFAEAGTLIERNLLRILGVDDQDRQHCYKPHTGEIIVRDRQGLDREVYERIDLGAKRLHDYRAFVDLKVPDCEVNWHEEAFPS